MVKICYALNIDLFLWNVDGLDSAGERVGVIHFVSAYSLGLALEIAFRVENDTVPLGLQAWEVHLRLLALGVLLFVVLLLLLLEAQGLDIELEVVEVEEWCVVGQNQGGLALQFVEILVALIVGGEGLQEALGEGGLE
jgi:hypothetical protein